MGVAVFSKTAFLRQADALREAGFEVRNCRAGSAAVAALVKDITSEGVYPALPDDWEPPAAFPPGPMGLVFDTPLSHDPLLLPDEVRWEAVRA